MLLDAIEKILQLSKVKAQAFLELLILEKRQLNQFIEKEPAIRLMTQDDLLTFLHEFSQATWFYGHDRSRFPINIQQTAKANYARIFFQLGLMQEQKYALKISPHFSVVLGSSAWQMRKRIRFLWGDLQQGILPAKQIIFGLGSNRPLGVYSVDAETNEKQRLLHSKVLPTEMNLLNKLMKNMLQQYNKRFTIPLYYWPIETTAMVATRNHYECITTRDTVNSLNAVLQREYSEIPAPRLLFYSQQPYIFRQQRDIQQVLTHDHIYCVGDSVNKNFFHQKQAVAIMLGEVARLIHQAYRDKDVKLMSKKLHGPTAQVLHELLNR